MRTQEKKLTCYVRVPNWIDNDTQMYGTTKKVLFALLARVGSGMTVRVSQEELARYCGCCRNTVAQALRELRERGILFSTRRYYYSRRLGRVVRGKTRYYLRRMNDGGSFTLVPRALLEEKLSGGEFVAALHAYRLAGRKGRCCPSLRRFARQIDRAKATVCRAVSRLHLRQVISRVRCKKANRAFACNSYYPTAWVRKKTGSGISAVPGGLKFEQQQVNNKITVGSIKRKTEKGVGEFGGLTKFFEKCLEEGQLYFDGTGVKVSVCDELELIG